MVSLKGKSRLKRAHNELFRRSADDQFSSMHDLHEHCRQEKQFPPTSGKCRNHCGRTWRVIRSV